MTRLPNESSQGDQRLQTRDAAADNYDLAGDGAVAFAHGAQTTPRVELGGARLRRCRRQHRSPNLSSIHARPSEPFSGHHDEAVRDEKARFLRGVRTLGRRDVVRGQYRGYREPMASTLRRRRWSGVPIVVRAGKCLPVKATEIIVELKRPPEKLFPTQRPHCNRLRFQIEPEIVIGLEVQSRKPGLEEFVVEDIELTAMRQAAHDIPPYQRLLSAALRGEHDLFASQETIEEAWRIVDPLLGNATPVHEYDRGSWGPAEADRLAPTPGWYAPRVNRQA